MIVEETGEQKRARAAVMSFMLGWRHGATGHPETQLDEHYLEGYDAGRLSRTLAYVDVLRRQSVTVEEAALWVLRYEE